MRPGQLPPWFSGTAIGTALRACKDVLVKRPDGDRMIVLITDGIDPTLGDGVDSEIAEELKDAGITLFAVVVGQDFPHLSAHARAQYGSVDTITKRTGGESFTALDPRSLETVFRRIDEMKRTEVERHISTQVDDLRPYSLAGLILTGLAMIGFYGLRYTPW